MVRKAKTSLSPLENKVMRVVWDRGTVTADDVRNVLSGSQQVKDSTVRTLLRRLEGKGYVDHTVDGRTYVYSPKIASRRVATDAVRAIIERFCEGSVENLLVGMVDDAIVSADKLRELTAKITKAEKADKR